MLLAQAFAKDGRKLCFNIPRRPSRTDSFYRAGPDHRAEDGFNGRGADVYCSWDVINYCYAFRNDPQAEPKAYWLNTSGNVMVRELIGKSADGTTQLEIERLIAGETINKALNEQLTHNEINKTSTTSGAFCT